MFLRRPAFVLLAGLPFLAPALAAAGPWARGEGKTFVSLSGEATGELAEVFGRRTPEGAPAYSLSVFAERGLSPRLTLGLDGAVSPGRDSFAGYAFVRGTLTSGDATHQMALTGGLGARDDGVLGVIGASWGRGIGTRWGNGWTTVEGQLRFIPGGVAKKLDATLGLNRSDTVSLIGQILISDYPGADLAARLSSSYVRKLGDRLSVEIGLLQGVANDDGTGLKIGAWLEF